MTGKTPTILIVEDNELDAEKIVRSMRRLKMTNDVVRATNGEEALGVLRGTNGQTKLVPPYIILLDINMPKMNGLEFLQALRADDALDRSPVFMLTTSDSQKDIDAAYQYNVCGYVVKPVKSEQMTAALKTLNLYWDVTELPTYSAKK